MSRAASAHPRRHLACPEGADARHTCMWVRLFNFGKLVMVRLSGFNHGADPLECRKSASYMRHAIHSHIHQRLRCQR